jgi:hypothetical protein
VPHNLAEANALMAAQARQGVAVPDAADLARMIAQENRSLASGGPSGVAAQHQQQQSRVQLGSNIASTATLSVASIAASAPTRTYVPLAVSQAARSAQANDKETLRKNARARAILKQVSLSVERFDDLFVMDPLRPLEVHARKLRRAMVRDAAQQFNEDNLTKEVQTDERERYALGVQVPDERHAAVAGRREIVRESNALTTSSSTSTATGPDENDDTAPLPSAMSSVSNERLLRFVAQGAAVVEALLLESGSASGYFRSLADAGSSPSSLSSISAGSLTLVLPAWLGRQRKVKDVFFSPARNQTVLVAYSPVVSVADGSSSSADVPAEEAEAGSNNVGEGLGLALKGLVLVWDLSQPSYPRHVLTCHGDPLSLGCDGRRGVVVFAGLEEGSLALWDLREDNALHQSVTVPSSTSSSSSSSASAHTFVLRAASFTTDSLPSSNHEAPVRRVAALDEHDLSSLAMGRPQNSAQVAIAQATAARDEAKALSSAQDDGEENAAAAFNVMALTGGGGASSGVAGAAGGGDGGMLGGVSFQLASLDDTGSLFVWSSIELSSETLDPAGSEADLGLAPGARVKLVRSAVLRDGNMHAKAANNKGKSGSGSTASGLGMQSFDVVFKPNETNEFVLSLGRGQVRRGRRYGAPVLPADYYQHAREQRLGDDCTTLCFHPLHPQFFLAGYKSGSVSLFNLSSSEALQTWVSLFSTAENDRLSAGYSSAQAGVQALRWSQQRPSVFFVTDARGKTVVFDLLRSAQKPVATVALQPDSSSSSMSNGLPVPGQTSAAPAIRPKPLLSVSQTVVGSPLALNQSLIAFPSASSSSSASTPAASVEVHQLKPALATSSDKERRQFAEYLEHVHQL